MTSGIARRAAISSIRPLALVLSVLITVGIVARYTNVIDRYFIFFPERELFLSPSDRGLEYEDVLFETQDGIKLHGWLVPGTDEKTMVWFHGNAGNVSHRVDNIHELHSRLGLSIFIFDYRGYGKSEGRPSEQGTYIDGEAALAYVASRGDVAGQRPVLFGRSMGCAIATEMATRQDVESLILESPLTSIQAMARRVYPFLPGIGLLARTRYDTLAKIKDVSAPVMVLHGDRDDTAPFDMGQEVFDAASAPKRFYAIEGASHNDTYVVGGDSYFEALAGFLSDPTGSGT